MAGAPFRRSFRSHQDIPRPPRTPLVTLLSRTTIDNDTLSVSSNNRQSHPLSLERQSTMTPRTLSVTPFVGGSLPPFRSAPRPVLGSTSLRGVSRSLSKGGVPSLRPPHAVHPPIASELPRPSRHTSRGKKRRENPRTLVGFFLHMPYARVLGPFPTRKKGRSVVRGGWRSECGEW